MEMWEERRLLNSVHWSARWVDDTSEPTKTVKEPKLHDLFSFAKKPKNWPSVMYGLLFCKMYLAQVQICRVERTKGWIFRFVCASGDCSKTAKTP